MSEQKIFPPKSRAPFQKSGRRCQPFRNSGHKSPAPGKNPERRVTSPENNNSTRPNHAKPHPLVRMQKHPQATGAAANTSYNCSELLEALKAIQKVAECCSCHKSLNTARTCASGHGFCCNCKNRCNKVCPLCDCYITERKPIMLNNIIKLLPRTCNFGEKGCDSLILPGDMNHEVTCRFRTVTCRFPSCAVKCMAKELLRHLEDFHGGEMIRTASHSQILMNFDARIKRDGLAVIVAYNNIIWQHIRVRNNQLLQIYQYVPMEKPKVKFSVEVNLYTPEHSFSSSTPVHTDQFDPHQLFKDGDAFCLPPKIATSFRRFYSGGVNYNFEIMKEDI